MKINKQTFLTVISIAGVTASVVVTAVMAPKADKAIKAKKQEITGNHVDHNEYEKVDNGLKIKYSTADKLELVKTAAPYYIPTALLSILTVGTIIVNHHVNRKALLGLSATTSYLVANRNQLKKYITENPKAKKLADEAKAYFLPSVKTVNTQTIEDTGNGHLLCIEGFSGRIFRSSVDDVIDAQTKLIEQYLDEEHGGEFGYCSMNDYYRYLGIQQTQFGNEYGWANNEDWFYKNEPIQFSNELIAADAPGNEFGEPVYCLDIEDAWFPMQCWQEI